MKGFLAGHARRASLVFSLFFFGCGGGGTGPQPAFDPGAPVDSGPELPSAIPEVSTPVDPGTDTPGGDLTAKVDEGDPGPQPGEFGWPCIENGECLSGFCLPVAEGKSCTKTCIDNCPEGFRCEFLELGGQDPTFLCVSLSLNICRPCKSHGDCSGLVSNSDARCIPFGESQGSFCASDCGANLGCPPGYTCELLVDPNDGESYEQCLPLSGGCECSQRSINEQAETNCGNEFCSGVRTCTDQGLSPCSAPPSEPEACDGVDNDCDGVTDNDFLDTDNDGIADCTDPDDDGDGFNDENDTCPLLASDNQSDLDEDGQGDECDDDDDGDEVGDDTDNCPTIPNTDQADSDNDQIGDVCEDDGDGDGIVDDSDNCPNQANADQADFDNDNSGDVCDPDDDADGILDGEDNCPFNPEITGDLDEDGFGDACDVDLDGDNFDNDVDNCPNIPNEDQANVDGDESGDACDLCVNDPDNDVDGDFRCADFDNCPSVNNPQQTDTDQDGLGDACDLCVLDETNDEDADGVCQDVDNCPAQSNSAQSNVDGDALGDVCDPCPGDASNDADADGLCGLVDNCPEFANVDQLDGDGDNVGDGCDTCPLDPNNDTDGDGLCAGDDNCPFDTNGGQEDLDEDGAGDACDVCANDADNDSDSDLVCGDIDNCPSTPNNDQSNIDGDAYGDVCDPCANDPIHEATPPAPPSISGLLLVNGAQSGVTYQVAGIPEANSYTWTVPAGATIDSGQGTASINVSFGFLSGAICVYASNGCGSGTSTCATVQVSNVPEGVIATWASSLELIPAGWVLCDGSNGTPDLRGRYVKGAVSPVEVENTGGSDSHDHGGLTGSTDLTTDSYGGGGPGSCGSGCNSTGQNHSHSASHQHGFGPSTNQPVYKEVLFIMNADGSPLSTGIIAPWAGDTTSIPFGWTLSNGSGGTPAFIGMYMVGAPEGLGGGDAGGLETHNHGSTGFDTRSLHIGLAPDYGSACDAGTGTSVGHAHDYEHQHQLPDSSNDLPYFTVAFLQANSAASFPIDSILMWHGNSADLPPGWSLCDGSNETPDLRDRYLKAIENEEDPGLTGGSATHNHGGNTNLDGGGATSVNTGIGSSGCGSPLALHQHTVYDHQHAISLSANHEPPHMKLHFIIRN